MLVSPLIALNHHAVVLDPSQPYQKMSLILFQVPWASLGRSPVLVELDRLYILAGPKVDDGSDEVAEVSLVQELPPETDSKMKETESE